MEPAIAFPSDPSNQARALALCEQSDLLLLKQGSQNKRLDIAIILIHLRFVEMDSPLIKSSFG